MIFTHFAAFIFTLIMTGQQSSNARLTEHSEKQKSRHKADFIKQDFL